MWHKLRCFFGFHYWIHIPDGKDNRVECAWCTKREPEKDYCEFVDKRR